MKKTEKEITHIKDLKFDGNNARLHNPRNIGMIEHSLNDVGAARSIVIDENGTILAGNGLVEAASQAGIHKVRVIQADGNEIIAVQRNNLSEEQKTLLALYDNRTSELSTWNPLVLADIAEHLSTEHLFYPEELTGTLIAAADAILQDDEPDDEDEPPTESTTSAEQDNEAPPDILFFSDNDWGIPTLDSNLQAEYVVVPVERWGRMARHGTTMPGTWHFYTEDYKFNNLWSNPNILRETGCVNAVEPNISTNAQMPKAVALWGIYRKRWIARFWQSQGIRVFVDLNVDRNFTEINLLGVPSGWASYATRGYDNDIALLEYDYQTASQHANRDDILFVVLGGGKRIQAMCKERAWHWIPQENHVTEGRQVAYGQG